MHNHGPLRDPRRAQRVTSGIDGVSACQLTSTLAAPRLLGMTPSPIGERLSLLCGPDYGDLSFRELDRLAKKTQGHAQAIATGTIADPRQSTLRAFEDVLGASLDPRDALPSPATVRAAIERVRASAPRPASCHHAPGPVVVREGYDQRTGTEG